VPDPDIDTPLGSEASPVSLTRELVELTRLLLTATTVEGVLQQTTVATRYLVPATDIVSITLREHDGNCYTPATSDIEAAELDDRQYETGEGPCLEAADPNGPAYVHSGDLATESAWPKFAHEAVEHGFASVLSTALITTEPAPFTTALNAHSRHRDALGQAARETTLLLATHITRTVRRPPRRRHRTRSAPVREQRDQPAQRAGDTRGHRPSDRDRDDPSEPAGR
jgi:hypothetical protein